MEKIKKIYSIIISVLLGIVILLAILLVGVRVVGFTPYTVLSGSMSPKYPVGSIVYVRKVNPFELKEEDVITYVIDGGTVVTHRIIEVLFDEDDPTVVRFRVKGDANEDPDGEPVHCNNVLGRVSFGIPLLGYVAYFVQRPPGSIWAIGLCVMLVILSFLPDLLDKLFKEEDDSPQESPKD